MRYIIYFNYTISLLFAIFYFYQLVYIFVGLFKKPKVFQASNKHRYAAIISARDEEVVIKTLIHSLQRQNYPEELVDIFVVADNCTDTTAQVARDMGAIVYERNDTEKIGKGYALDWLFKHIKEDYPDSKHEAYIVFDADNVVDPNFIAEMNKLFDNGYKILTSYRNSKNYGENWITAGYSLWFLREAKFLNNARMKLGTSCAISGTGFLVSRDIIERNGGWKHHLLTEDIEFTTDSIIHGEKVGYCDKAMLYDEQPRTFHQSYLQRLRWSKGFYQVCKKYSFGLLKGIAKKRFSCYDMLMTIAPAMLLTLLGVAVTGSAAIWAVVTASPLLPELLLSLLETLFGFYSIFFVLALITTISERKKIHCRRLKKVLFVFTFPLFMLTYIPISIIAIFKKVTWAPIKHTVNKDLFEIHDKHS